MNRLIAAFVGLLGICIALPATAQTAMPSMSAPWNWTGFYLGIQGGYGFGQADHIANFGPAILDVSGTFSADGGIVGVTGGYNHQFGHFVLGLETDVSKTWLSGQTAGIPPAFCPTGGPTANCKSSLDWLVTARPRLGYAFGQFLPYIDGGLAVAGVRPAACMARSVVRKQSPAGLQAPVSKLPSRLISAARSNISISVSPIRTVSTSSPRRGLTRRSKPIWFASG